MTYNKKRMLSYGVILISVLLAYFCRLVRPKNTFARNFADQCRNCIYLGLYCAWVIYLEKHVVYKKMRRCLTAIGCLMVFWFFVRTVKFHIFHEPLGEHICWYLYYIPMILMKGRRSIFPIFHPRSNIPGITGSQNCFFPGILLFLIRMISIPVRQSNIHP